MFAGAKYFAQLRALSRYRPRGFGTQIAQIVMRNNLISLLVEWLLPHVCGRLRECAYFLRLPGSCLKSSRQNCYMQ